jgi:pimeloyl-ACP methyl ester carboxylesterase
LNEIKIDKEGENQMSQEYSSVYKSKESKIKLLSVYDTILSKWPIPFSEIFLDSSFGRTHIIQCGNITGFPLMLFHGTGNNSLMWRYNCEELGKHYCLYLVDTINDPGKSELSKTFNPKNDYIKWVNSIIDQLHLDKVNLIGHSKGGWIALNTSILLPHKVNKLILLAPAVGINSKLNSTFLWKSIMVGINPSIKNVRKYFEYMSSPGKEQNIQYLEYVSSLIRGTKSKPISHRVFSDIELQTMNLSTLLIFGEHEKCLDYHSVIERATKLIPNLTTRIIPNTGHGLQGENPALVNSIIIRFLNTN